MTSIQEIKKTGKLKDGTEVVLRPMDKTDRRQLGDFFGRLPSAVLQYVRNDVTDPQVLDKWFAQLDYNKVFPLLALIDNKVVANASIHRVAYGWGTLMINELVDLAHEFGLEKLMVEFPLKAHSALVMFKKAGFSPRAVIEGLMKNRHGEDLDVVIMVMDVAAYAGRI